MNNVVPLMLIAAGLTLLHAGSRRRLIRITFSFWTHWEFKKMESESFQGNNSCTPEHSILPSLMDVIASRKGERPSEHSYVGFLLNGGVEKIGAKIVEEAAEVVEASGEPGEAGRMHLINEVADLVFHTLVMLGYRDILWSDVEKELARRFGISGITEKEARIRKN